MRPKSFKEVPAHVRRAIVHDNLEQLRVSGKKGAEVTNEIKANKAEAEAHRREKSQKAEWERMQATNEHIAPIDPDDPRHNTEKDLE